ncbi:MAG: hypothetical protein J6T51_05170 [Kiritimatiellae bacterium]|nr:hypothetical protein [Kiritimatiellia bacterium]
MKAKTVILLAATLATAAAMSATTYRGRKGPRAMAGNEDGPVTSGKEAKILVNQPPKTGQSCCLPFSGVQGASMIGQCYTKPRKWIVIETKYTTYAKFLDQLTFNWHVLLDTRSAKENKGNQMGLAPYSYFNTSVTYFNIPQGSHAACVCLPPSYLELYGEPKAIGFTISNQNGDVLGGDSVSEIPGIKAGTQFWDDQNIMNKTGADGKPMIERRQGLVDRSKTIWALVNPNDYEATAQ